MRRIISPESSVFTDASTGRQVRQVTSGSSVHHHPFFLVPAYDGEGRWLFIVSHRTGKPQVFGEERSTGRLIQLTDVEGLDEWSVHPSLDGEYVYFTTSMGGYRVELSNMNVEQVLDLAGSRTRSKGMVAGGMGTTALSNCGRYWAVKTQVNGGAKLQVVDTANLRNSTVTEHDSIAHMQFCPDDPELIFFAGSFKQRLWTVRLDGSEKREHYQRQPGQWITHESWIPSTKELAFVDWPHGLRSVNTETGTVRSIADFNAWHAISDDQGQMMVADTNYPDTGIYTFSADGVGRSELICKSGSSNAGKHWNGPFPYEDGPISVYAPQHTHPHPRFSPGNTHIVFTSDRTGTAHVYEVDLRK